MPLLSRALHYCGTGTLISHSAPAAPYGEMGTRGLLLAQAGSCCGPRILGDFLEMFTSCMVVCSCCMASAFCDDPLFVHATALHATLVMSWPKRFSSSTLLIVARTFTHRPMQVQDCMLPTVTLTGPCNSKLHAAERDAFKPMHSFDCMLPEAILESFQCESLHSH